MNNINTATDIVAILGNNELLVHGFQFIVHWQVLQQVKNERSWFVRVCQYGDCIHT